MVKKGRPGGINVKKKTEKECRCDGHGDVANTLLNPLGLKC